MYLIDGNVTNKRRFCTNQSEIKNVLNTSQTKMKSTLQTNKHLNILQIETEANQLTINRGEMMSSTTK